MHFATYLGAAVELSADDITDSIFKGFDILHLEGYLVFNHSLVEKAILVAKRNGLKVSMDLASFNIVEANLDFLKGIIISSVDIVFANEEESKALTGELPEKSLDIIAEMCEIAVVKIGSKGSMVKRGNEMVKVDAIKANAIDTTGAGDLFASGFIYGLIQGWSLEKCAKLGALTAGKVVETIGAKISPTVWQEINITKNAI